MKKKERKLSGVTKCMPKVRRGRVLRRASSRVLLCYSDIPAVFNFFPVNAKTDLVLGSLTKRRTVGLWSFPQETRKSPAVSGIRRAELKLVLPAGAEL